MHEFLNLEHCITYYWPYDARFWAARVFSFPKKRASQGLTVLLIIRMYLWNIFTIARKMQVHENKKIPSELISTHFAIWSRIHHQTLLVFHTHSVKITVSYLVQFWEFSLLYPYHAYSIMLSFIFYVGLLQSLQSLGV